VSVEFVPTAATYTNNATLTITTNNSSQPSITVAIGGLNPRAYEGANEPSLVRIKEAFGYGTNVGIHNNEGKPNYVSNTRLPVGDEIISPYFRRADTSRPVHVEPLARFSGRDEATQQDSFGWTTYGSTVKNRVYSFPGDTASSYTENQKLFPSVNGSHDFVPGADVFGLYGNAICYSDDRFNGTSHEHDWRVFPAKRVDGSVIPNTYLLALDALVNSADKNYDYQEQLLLVSNIRPAETAAAAPGAATTLEFSSAVAGTIADKDGQGTGFSSVMANNAGNQYLPGNIDLDAAAGVLKLTSTAGTASNRNNTQQNALRMAFDGTRSRFALNTRLVGPFSNVASGFQQEALFFGPDQDNFIKVEVENSGGHPAITLFFEENGTGSGTTPIVLPNPETITSIDLRLIADPATGTITAWYGINGAATTQVGTGKAPADVMRWFSSQAQGGILVSNEGSTTPITATFDRFSVVPN
jgi:hypothetical protein